MSLVLSNCLFLFSGISTAMVCSRGFVIDLKAAERDPQTVKDYTQAE